MIGMRQVAHNDAELIMKEATGFVWPCTVTSPAGVPVIFSSRTTDIHQTIDAGTGEIITGRIATCTLLIKDLIASSFQTISGVAETTSKPWVIEFDDVGGRSYKFKVSETFPDNTLGLMVCTLEVYS